MLNYSLNSSIKLYTIYTSSHEVLFKNFFLPSLLDRVCLIAKKLDRPGGYFDLEFNSIIHLKVAMIIKSIEDNLGEIVVWSDVDIQFFRKFAPAVVASLVGANVVFSPEARDGGVNSGFFGVKSNAKTLDFFRLVEERLKVGVGWPDGSEQPIINDLLGRVDYNILPITFWNQTVGRPIPKGIILHHANNVDAFPGMSAIVRKTRALREVEDEIKFGRKQKAVNFFLG